MSALQKSVENLAPPVNVAGSFFFQSADTEEYRARLPQTALDIPIDELLAIIARFDQSKPATA